MRALILTSLVILGAGCATEPTDLTLLEGSGVEADGKIYGGSPPDAPEHEAVVALHQLARGGKSVYVSPFCSGTLIRGDVVLTAAHCMSRMSASKLAVYVGDDPSVDLTSHLYTVSEILVHSSYSSSTLLNDIALVRLDSSITEAVAPVAELAAADAVVVGELINFTGFGETETGSSGVKLQVDGTIDALGCGVSGCPGSGDSATQFSYEQPTTGPCFGDSGGPAFAYRAGVPYVAGLTSYGDSYCAIYGVSTRVDAFETFITDFADGSSGGDSGGPPPADDCGDGVCGTGESCDGRSGTTSCSADCDGVTKGKPSGRYCYVEGVCEGSGCP